MADWKTLFCRFLHGAYYIFIKTIQDTIGSSVTTHKCACLKAGPWQIYWIGSTLRVIVMMNIESFKSFLFPWNFPVFSSTSSCQWFLNRNVNNMVSAICQITVILIECSKTIKNTRHINNWLLLHILQFNTIRNKSWCFITKACGGGSLLRWIHPYILNRYQFVCVNGHNSRIFQKGLGVPQGYHLGHLFFII